MNFKFPKDFAWGTATASYQIEGATREDGRGLSTWDVFCDEPGRIDNGDSGAIACDHYHRWSEDIALMKELNLNSYRFSLSWPRILPDGDGKPNAAGLDFYNRIIDALLEVGITPYITLFHWDLPYSLQQRYGGWRSRETVDRFTDYSALCGKEFGDRVKNWFTINEISCFTHMAHADDRFAPGGKLAIKEVNQTIHHALLAHGRATQELRGIVPDAHVGLVENLVACWPLYEEKRHIEAARTAFRDYNCQRLFPQITASYDTEAYQRIYGDLPDIQEGDMDIIASQVDFLAYNYYFAYPIIPADNDIGYRIIPYPKGYPQTDMGWNISPRGLYWTLSFSKHFFPDHPIYITENGQAAQDSEDRNGEVWDIDRLEYYRTHLEMASRAIGDGVNLKGYFAWSLMDNFEWASGYSKRFGLVRVNYRTQKRTIKASGRFYADVIKEGRVL